MVKTESRRTEVRPGWEVVKCRVKDIFIDQSERINF